MDLKKYINLLTSGRWSTKDPKYSYILALTGLAQKLLDESKKSSNKPNSETTKVEPAYIRYLPPWIM